MNFIQQHRLYVKSCYDKSWTYEISHHAFQMTNNRTNSMKINLITETNDSFNKKLTYMSAEVANDSQSQLSF